MSEVACPGYSEGKQSYPFYHPSNTSSLWLSF
jgi:hypothetical protein